MKLMTRTLLIVDDHESFRSFARMLLSAEGFDVAGEAADGEAAVAEVERLHPDVVLLDIGLPRIDGFEVARRLAASADAPRVVLTSSREASDYGSQLANAPATGFIPKRELSGDALASLVDGA
jgi:DNA-binding NarL/FixJ family response regulator